jgi:hypothetical protein
MRCATIGGLTLFVVFFCIVFIGSMLADAYGPQYSIGAAEVDRPAPNITEPGNPIFEGLTAGLALFGGSWFIWKRMGGTTTPAQDALKKYDSQRR